MGQANYPPRAQELVVQLCHAHRALVFLVQMAPANHLREVLARQVTLAPVGLAAPAKSADFHQHPALRCPLDERPHELAAEFSWDPPF
jgi:hypothetical protein